MLDGQLLVTGPDIVNLDGLAGLTSAGDVIVQSCPLLASVTGLSSLRSVSGSLWLQFNPSLPSLAGLQSVETIGDSLLIGGNDLVTDLDVFVAIQRIGAGGLHVFGNPALTSLEGLRSIRSVTGDVSIISNAALTGVGGLRALRTIGGALFVRFNESLQTLAGLSSLRSMGELFVESNPTLSRLGFASLDTVDLAISLLGNPALTSLSGLQRVSSLRVLAIVSDPALQSLDGLDSIHEVTDSLEIRFNPGLRDLDGIDGLERVGSAVIANNDSLRNLDGLARVTAIEGDAVFAGISLASLDGLAQVRIVDGTLAITSPLVDNVRGLSSLRTAGSLRLNLPAVETLDGMRSLETVTVVLALAGNTRLRGLAALARLKEVEGLTIADNDALVDLHGLDSLERVGFFGVTIEDNDALRSLAGLGSLAEIDGDLRVATNNTFVHGAALTSLDGLDSLVRVGQSVRIEDNPLLADVDGLGELGYAASLSLKFNPRLRDCGGVTRLLDVVDDPPEGPGAQLLDAPDVAGVELQANGPGCGTVEEILASPPDFPCQRDANTACLLDDRFRVRADMWDFSGGSLVGNLHRGVVQTYDAVRAETENAVSFYSFEEGNVELFVKVLDACPLSFHSFWVFAAGATNAQAEVEVLDAWTGEKIRIYNPRSALFQTTAATDAFATCDALSPWPAL